VTGGATMGLSSDITVDTTGASTIVGFRGQAPAGGDDPHQQDHGAGLP
jgi:hypothetical protein